MTEMTSRSKTVAIGVALAVAGYVIMKKLDGIRQVVSEGDLLHSDDHIQTGPDGEVTIGFADGTSLVVPPQSEAVLDAEVVDVDEIREMHSHDSVLQSMQQAILDGGDADSALQIAVVTADGEGGEDIAPISPPPGADDTPGGGSLDDAHNPPEMMLPKIMVGDLRILEPTPGNPDEQGGSGHDTGEDSGHDSGGHDTGEDSGHDSGGHDTGEDSEHDSGGHDTGEDSEHDSGGHDTGDDSGHDSGGHDTGDDSGGHDTGDDSSHASGGGYSAGQGGGYGYAGGSLSTVAVFTVSLSAPTERDVRVDFRTVDGTAISGGEGVDAADYGEVSGTLVIPAGQSYGTIEVTIYGDRLVENDEQFFIRLSNPVNAIIADDTSIASIIDSGHGHGSTGEGEILIGTPGDDVLETRGGEDVIEGLAGDDILIAGGGADVIRGGEGDDLIVGLGGPDELYGEAGDDEIIGHGGQDLIDGGPGDDIIYAGGAPDQVLGGPGDDFINAEGGPDVVDGGEGRDTIYGGGGPDQLFGGPGNDVIRGEGGPDLLDGGPGEDELYGGGGPDQLLGGAGDDMLKGGGSADVFRFESLDGSIDRIVDFSQHDQIDISALLEFDQSDPISNYVRLTPNTEEASSYDLSVNPSGNGEVNDFQTIAVLENLSFAPNIDDLLTNGNLVVIE